MPTRDRPTPRTLLLPAALFAAALLLLTLATPVQAHPQSPFEPMDVFQLEYAADPQISPDGAQVVYVRTSMDIMKDRKRGEIWIVNADGSDHRRLATGSSPAGPPTARASRTPPTARSTSAGWTPARLRPSRS